MLVEDLIGNEIRCAYEGRLPSIPKHFFLSEDAPLHLAQALASELGPRRACVLFDERTRRAAGAPCLHALAAEGFEAREMLVPDRDGASPVCDDHTLRWLLARMPSTDVIVAVGSGVINDLAKWAAATLDVPYAVLATASSMNGYTSANVAPTVEGVKSLVPGKAARAVAAAPSVLGAAPYRMTTAGFGDLIAKPVSTADWVVSQHLTDEPFSAALAALADRPDGTLFARPEGLAQGDPASVRALFEALVLSGCAMTLHGSSLPASGGEHVISHTLDMMSAADGTPHDLHGRQVGVATIVVAALWQRLMEMQAPVFEPVLPPLEASIWGAAAPAVQRQHEAKEVVLRMACERLSLSGYWDGVREAVRPHLRPPAWVKDRLHRANGATRLSHIGCSRARFLTALRHGSAMRTRLTCLDLVRMAGLPPEQEESIVDTWVT